MSHGTPDRARQLELRFVRDTELTCQLNDAHGRLKRAHDRLWRGMHPDGTAAVYSERPAAGIAAFSKNRSEVLGAPDPLQALRQIHWEIHKAHYDYQRVADDRRRLAADIGEIIRTFLDELMPAGWSETEARDVEYRRARRLTPGGGTMVDRNPDFRMSSPAASRDREQRFELWFEHVMAIRARHGEAR